MTERELRSELLNTLLTTPHRNLAEAFPVHEQMIEQDPLFYVHLAAWYADHGQVRDHKEMFVIMLCLSNFEGHRDVGGLPVFHDVEQGVGKSVNGRGIHSAGGENGSANKGEMRPVY